MPFGTLTAVFLLVAPSTSPRTPPVAAALTTSVQGAQSPTWATVTNAGPIFLLPDAARQPLRVAAAGTTLNVQKEDGDWVQVEFADPQWGPRIGWIQAKFIRISRPGTEPMNLSIGSVPGPNPPVPTQSTPVVTGSEHVPPTSPSRKSDANVTGATPRMARGRIPIYLTTLSTQEGFTDPDKSRQDSMKDLAEALSKKKNLSVVLTREDAVIVLEVLARSVREDSGTYTKVFGGKNEVKSVRAKLSVSGFSAELSGESAGGGMGGGPGRGAWKKAAYKLADQIEKWVQENDAQLQKSKAP